jgi:hypothetical protein
MNALDQSGKHDYLNQLLVVLTLSASCAELSPPGSILLSAPAGLGMAALAAPAVLGLAGEEDAAVEGPAVGTAELGSAAIAPADAALLTGKPAVLAGAIAAPFSVIAAKDAAGMPAVPGVALAEPAG